jgi:predicted Ser/Thr protein kinase
MQVQPLTEKLLAAAANTYSVKWQGREHIFKKKMSKSQKQIFQLEAKFDEQKKNLSQEGN